MHSLTMSGPPYSKHGGDEPASYAVVMTVRTDSFQEVQTSARLEGVSTRLLDLRPLPIYRFAEAIEQPASRYGVEIEPQLVELLMEDAGGRDALPLLAFTLQRLWRQYERERRIRKDNYESIGKLLGIIEDAAERALRGLDPGAQQGPLSGKVPSSRDAAAQRVFVPALAQVNERGGTVRRVAALSSFDEEGRGILYSFEKWRLVVTSGPSVEVAHEALFRAWPRFQRWLEPEKARLETLRGVESAASSWDFNGRKYDFISHAERRLRDAQALMRLSDFRTFIEENRNVKDYLKAAGRAARGWRIANWYTLTVLYLYVIFIAGTSISAYSIGYHGIEYFLLGAAITRLLVNTPGIASAYLAAALRQVTIRSGAQYDVPVFFLTSAAFVIAVAAYLTSNIFLSGSLEQAGHLIREQVSGLPEYVDDKFLGVFYFAGDFFNLLEVPPLIWAAIQLLVLVTIPIKSFSRKR